MKWLIVAIAPIVVLLVAGFFYEPLPERCSSVYTLEEKWEHGWWFAITWIICMTVIYIGVIGLYRNGFFNEKKHKGY